MRPSISPIYPAGIPDSLQGCFRITWEVFEICYEETLPTPILFLPGDNTFYMSAKGHMKNGYHLRQLLGKVEGRHYAFNIKPPKPLLESYDMHE